MMILKAVAPSLVSIIYTTFLTTDLTQLPYLDIKACLDWIFLVSLVAQPFLGSSDT